MWYSMCHSIKCGSDAQIISNSTAKSVLMNNSWSARYISPMKYHWKVPLSLSRFHYYYFSTVHFFSVWVCACIIFWLVSCTLPPSDSSALVKWISKRCDLRSESYAWIITFCIFWLYSTLWEKVSNDYLMLP